MIEWPSNLPQADGLDVMTDGYAEAEPDYMLRSATETGPGKRRLRSVMLSQPMTVVLMCEYWQAQRIKTFYREDLSLGALPFTFPEPRIDGTAVLDEDGEPSLDENDDPVLFTSRLVVAFSGGPIYAPVDGVCMQVTLPLEVLP